MNKWVNIFLVLFVFSTSFSLTSVKNQTINNCITCNPILKFYISSDEDISINYANISLNESDINYVSFYPKKIFSGQTALFEFDLDEIPCNYLNKSIQVNLTINYTNSSGNYIYNLKNYVFKLSNPLKVSLERNYESIEVGNDVEDLLYINNTCKERNLSISVKIPQNVYILYYTPEGVSDSLNSIKILNGYPIDIDIIGSYLGDENISINITDTDCSNVSWNGSIEVQTYTISKGITSFKSMSELSPLISLVILSSIVFGKIIKKGLMK